MSDRANAQRAVMAADLAERAALDLRFRKDGRGIGRAVEALEQARCLVTRSVDPEADYREGLNACGVPFADIDAAVAAIARGEHPPDSLPGMVAIYKGHTDREIPRRPGDTIHVLQFQGESIALGWVLEQLGCPELQR
jgi:hypothetical protein